MQAVFTRSERKVLTATDSDQERYNCLYQCYASIAYGLILRFMDSGPEANIILKNVFLELCSNGVPDIQSVSKHSVIQLTLRLTADYIRQNMSKEVFTEKSSTLILL